MLGKVAETLSRGIFACRFLRKTLPGAAGEPGEYPASFSVLSTVMAGSEEEITAGRYQFIVEGVTSEIGVRLALGASRPRLVWLILRQGMVPIVMGLVAGVATALIVGRFMQSLL